MQIAVDQELMLRLENHWLACMAAAGGGGRVTRLAGATVVVNPRVAGMSFNFISLRQITPADLSRVLTLGAALLAAEQRPPAAYLTPVAGEMEPLQAALSQAGWQRLLRQAVLVRPLPLERLTAPDIAVAEVAPAELTGWGEVLVQAYEVAPADAGPLQEAWTRLQHTPGTTVRAYLGYVEGRPAGTGLLWQQGEVAGLYCGAVLPAYRRRSVETATLIRRLQDAAAMGARWATLQTDAGSPVEHLCRNRLGFVPAYYRELWAPAAYALRPAGIVTPHCR
jgi:GNAT superfamily N-acetyltransferase